MEFFKILSPLTFTDFAEVAPKRKGSVITHRLIHCANKNAGKTTELQTLYNGLSLLSNQYMKFDYLFLLSFDKGTYLQTDWNFRKWKKHWVSKNKTLKFKSIRIMSDLYQSLTIARNIRCRNFRYIAFSWTRLLLLRCWYRRTSGRFGGIEITTWWEMDISHCCLGLVRFWLLFNFNVVLMPLGINIVVI